MLRATEFGFAGGAEAMIDGNTIFMRMLEFLKFQV